jgi:tetratricopeptide (TPR) repeat protein
LSASQKSFAQDDAAANDPYEMAFQGLVAFKAGQFAEALDKYTRAFSIVKLPALAVHMARADVKLGRFVAAAELYEQAMQLGDGVGDSKVQARARVDAQVERAGLLLRIPKLLIRIAGVEPATVSVQVDGARIPSEMFQSGWLVDPGTHKVSASIGTQQQEQLAAIAEGEGRELRFVFKAKLGSESANNGVQFGKKAVGETSTMRTAAWASFGVGGAGLLFWGTTGLVAWSKSSHLKSEHCGQGSDQSTCPRDEEASYTRWKTLAGVGFYTGAAGLLTGAVLYFAEPNKRKSRDSNARVLPWLGVGSAGVEGQF